MLELERLLVLLGLQLLPLHIPVQRQPREDQTWVRACGLGEVHPSWRAQALAAPADRQWCRVTWRRGGFPLSGDRVYTRSICRIPQIP